jgi:hypothetical protein
MYVVEAALPPLIQMTQVQIQTMDQEYGDGGFEQTAQATKQWFRNKATLPGDVHCVACYSFMQEKPSIYTGLAAV